MTTCAGSFVEASRAASDLVGDFKRVSGSGASERTLRSLVRTTVAGSLAQRASSRTRRCRVGDATSSTSMSMLDVPLDELRLGFFDFVDWNRNVGLGAGFADAAVNLVEDEMVVVLRNPREFRVGTEFLFEPFDGTGACIPRHQAPAMVLDPVVLQAGTLGAYMVGLLVLLLAVVTVYQMVEIVDAYANSSYCS